MQEVCNGTSGSGCVWICHGHGETHAAAWDEASGRGLVVSLFIGFQYLEGSEQPVFASNLD